MNYQLSIMNYQLKKYPKYKPSGIEWIGEIPEHWDLIRSKFKINYKKGKNPIELNSDGLGKVYLTMDYLRENPKQVYYVKNYNDYVTVSENSILLLWDGSNAGEFIKAKEGVLSSTMAVLIFNGIDENYIWYFLKAYERQLREFTIGMGIPHVNSEELKNQIIILPPLPEQTAIANFLDDKTAKIDSLIEKKKKLIELYKEERTAVINHYVLGQHLIDNSQLTIDNGQLTINNGQLTINNYQLPKHWEVKKLKYVAKVNNENLSENEDDDLLINYIDISSVDSDGNIVSTTEYLYPKAPSRARRKLKSGDTILSTVRTYLKAIAFIDKAYDNLICSTGFAVISPSEVFIPKFLFFNLRSNIVIEKIMANSKGVSYPAIDSEEIKFLYVWYPPKEEQQQIVEHIEFETKRIDDKIARAEKEIELLQEYRTALINEVVTGKIKVIDN